MYKTMRLRPSNPQHRLLQIPVDRIDTTALQIFQIVCMVCLLPSAQVVVHHVVSNSDQDPGYNDHDPRNVLRPSQVQKEKTSGENLLHVCPT